jgi:hypothetical protein
MFKYFYKLYDDIKVYTYNYLNGNENIQSYPKLLMEDEEDFKVCNNIDDKQLRIDILLFVRQFKNTYYKYTNKEKFNPELYNSFVDDKNFDGGLTAFDDDDGDTRIFDKYILEYIKNRGDVLTYLQCKKKNVILKFKLEQLNHVVQYKEDVDIIFAIDMGEKDLFNYCYSIIAKTGNVSVIKNIVFSIILKYNDEFIRIKLSAFNRNKNSHPYLILERFIS